MNNALTKLLVALSILLPCAALAACGDDEESGSGGAATTGESAGTSDEDQESEDEPEREAKVIGSDTGKGDFPATSVSATVENPGAIKVKATPSPAKSTRVSWTVACRVGSKAGTRNGEFTVTAPGTKTLNKPIGKPDTCNVSSSAQMSGSGTIKLEIIG